MFKLFTQEQCSRSQSYTNKRFLKLVKHCCRFTSFHTVWNNMPYRYQWSLSRCITWQDVSHSNSHIRQNAYYRIFKHVCQI